MGIASSELDPGPPSSPAPPPVPSDGPRPVRPPGPTHPARDLALAAGTYLLLSLVVWWNVWSTHPTSTTTCGCGDSSLFTWFLEWPAYAMAHGLNPLYSTAMFHPTGVNLVANTAEVGIGVVLAPVTWLFGPVATLNVALTLSPFLSALAMFVLLRRWTTWAPAALVGGLLYGFSPFALVGLTDGHLMLGMGVVPPLVIGCLDEILIRQGRRPRAVGVMLGLLVAVQFFIGTELLTITVVAGIIGVGFVVAFGLAHPDGLRSRLPYVARAVTAAAVTAVAVLAYPTWFALAGPAHFTGSVWPGSILGRGGTHVANYVFPSASPAAIVALLHHIGGYQGAFLSNQYFGIGLLVVLVGGLAVWHRDRRLWLFGAVALVSIPFSFGLENSWWVPWRIFVRLPLIQNIIPVRFVAVTYVAAAVMLGIVVDHVHQAVGARSDRTPPRTASAPSPRTGRWAGAVAGTVVSAIALVPIADYLSQIVPMTTQPVLLPAWFHSVAPHVAGRQVLLAFPVPLSTDTLDPLQSAMTWQAVDRMHYSMVGGGGPASRVTPAGVERQGQTIVSRLSGPFDAAAVTGSEIRTLRHAIDRWGVTMVVVPDQPGLPVYERVADVRSVAMVVTAAIGERPIHRAQAWVWPQVRGTYRPSTAVSRFAGCVTQMSQRPDASVDAATACVQPGH